LANFNTVLFCVPQIHHTEWCNLAKVNYYDFALTNAKGSSDLGTNLKCGINGCVRNKTMLDCAKIHENWFRHFEDISRCEPSNIVACFFGANPVQKKTFGG